MQLKRKIPVFVFGLSVGLLVGIGFFIFKLDDYFNKIKNAAGQIKIIERPVAEKKDKQEQGYTSSNPYKINTKVSPYTNYRSVDSLIRADESEITVAKEELISIKAIKLIDIDRTQQDTASANLAGVNNDDNDDPYFVEFWKTPLNSKGYRMTRNRIILYGFSDFFTFNLYKVDDVYYLKSQEHVYKLSLGTDFMPMEKVHDSDLLARIN